MKSKTVSIFICVMMVAGVLEVMEENGEQVSPSSNGTGGLADSPWPMFRQNERHTGLSPYDTSGNDGQLKWSFETEDIIQSSPSIGSDGTIYLGSTDGKLYAINPDGTEKWQFATGYDVTTSPAIGSDGTIYISSEDTKLYAINPDGSEKWSFSTGSNIDSSPAIDSDGTIYVASVDNFLYAINPDGTQKWRYDTSTTHSSPAIGADGTIYIGSYYYDLFAINPTGTEKWRISTGSSVHSSPAIVSDGTIYVGSADKKLYAINPDGTEKWSFLTAANIYSSPAIGPDDTIYVGSYDTKMYAINPDGTEKWNFQTGGEVSSSPSIGSDGTIFIGSYDNKLYAINPEGTEKWSYTTNGIVKSSPVIGSDGTIYIGSYDGNLYAIGGVTHPWPMFGQNPRNTGLSPYDTSSNNGQLKWNFTIGNYIRSSPAIDSDGTIYIGSHDNKLYAINPDGTEKWDFLTGGEVWSSPAIGSDGTIYVGSNDHKLYAINPNGTQKWNFTTTSGGGQSSPVIDSEGTIYIGSNGNEVYAINPDGTQKWSFTTIGDGIHSSPAIGSDGTIYVGSHDYKLYAINPDGTQKWSFTTGDEVDSSPAIGFDGTIYVGSLDNNLYAINPDGSEKWSFTTLYEIHSSPAISSDGTIYVGSRANRLYAINPDGTEKWNFMTDGSVYSSPAIGSDGTIYVGSDDYKLYAINPDGTEKWNFMTGDAVRSSPAIGTDGTIYIGSWDGNLYAIGGIVHPWPMFRHNARHTGLSPYDTSGNNGAEKWNFTASQSIASSPSICFDGTIYVGSSDDMLYAINPNGSQKWNFSTGSDVLSSPAIGFDGTIYVGSRDGKVYAINPDGTEKWNYATYEALVTSPVIDIDGTIYIGSQGINLFAINPDGTKKWNLDMGDSMTSSPAIGADGTIYVGCDNYHFYAINPDGSVKWNIVIGDDMHSSPAISNDGTIYVGGGRNLYAIRVDGSIKWNFVTGDWVYSSPAISSDGTIYVGSHDNKLYAINSNGTEKWNFTTGHNVQSSPAIGSDGTIYVGSLDNKLYAINPDGSEKWNFTTGGYVRSSPAIGSDGTIYIGGRKLYAIGTPLQNQQPVADAGPDQIVNEGDEVQFDASNSYGSSGQMWDPSIVALWHMNEGEGDIIYDSTPYQNHGSIQGANWISDGKFGNALVFDGLDDYIEVKPSDEIFGDNPDEWSYSVWFRTTNDVDDMTLISDQNARQIHPMTPLRDPNFALNLILEPRSDEYDHSVTTTLGYGDETSSTTSGWGLAYNCAGGDWHLVTVTISKTENRQRTYIDNEIIYNHITLEGFDFFDGDMLHIGTQWEIPDPADPDSGIVKWPLDGSIDEVILWNRELSEQEVLEYYNSGKEYFLNSQDGEAEIVSYEWDFDSDGIYDYQETPTSAPDGAFDGMTRHTYGDDGVYTATLRIIDDNDESDTDTCEISVNNVKPTLGVITASGTSKVAEDATEEWVARYDGPANGWDVGYDIAVDSSGNVYVTGQSQLIPGTRGDYTTIKYDSYGNELWAARYNGPNDDRDVPEDIEIDTSGNVYVTGNDIGIGTSSDYATIKYDTNGNELWVARYDGVCSGADNAKAIAVDASGNVYVTGESSKTGTDLDYITIKYDPNGNELWISRYDSRPGDYTDRGWDITVDTAQNVYVTGYGEGIGTGSDYVTIKYDSNGNELWVARYNGPGNGDDRAFGISVDPLGNVYVAGDSVGIGTERDYATIKYDANGNELWVGRYDGPGNGEDIVHEMDIDSLGNVFVTGHSYGTITHSDATTVAYDSSGNELWVTRFNGPIDYFECAHSIIVDGLSEKVYVTGDSYSTETNYDLVTIAYDYNGNELWVERYDGPGNIDDGGYAVSIDSFQNVYVTGYSWGNSPFPDFVTIKYSALRSFECDEGTLLTFSATASDSGSDDLTFTWDWGDGTTDIVTNYYNDGANPEPAYDPIINEIKSPWGNFPFTATDTLSHTYGDDGVYIITLTVEDDDGGTMTTVTSVLVNNVEPTLGVITGPSASGGSGEAYEEWVARYNGPGLPGNNDDTAKDIAVDSFGNVYVTGGSASSDTWARDYTTIKYDTDGNLLWSARFDNPYGDDIPRAITVDQSGNVYVIGSMYGGDPTSGGTGSDYITIKYDSNGNELWVAKYNGPGNDEDGASSICVDTTGNVFVTGYSTGVDTNRDLTTVKYDSSGTQIWVARYNGPDNSFDGANALIIDSAGNVFVTGSSFGIGTNLDCVTVKYDSNGNELWDARYNGPGNDIDGGHDIALDSYANVYVTGVSVGSGTDKDFMTLAYDSSGTQLWVARYNGPENDDDSAYNIATDLSGNIIVTGFSFGGFYDGGGPNYDFTTLAYDSLGNELWVARYNGPGNDQDYAYDLALDMSGNIYVTGPSYTRYHSNFRNYATVAYSPNGNELWSAIYNGPGPDHSDDHPVAIATDLQGNVYVTGLSEGIDTNEDYLTIKYSSSTKYECDEGSTAAFTATASDPGSDDLTFTWDWGDGTIDTVATYYNDGANPEPDYDPSTNEIKSPLGVYPFEVSDSVNHIYGDDGEYTITLTVEDDDGGITIQTMTIIVNNVAPAIESINTPAGNEGSQITFSSTATDLGSDDLSFTWDWGDGTSTIINTYYNDGAGPDPYPSPLGTHPFTVTEAVQHTYGDNGVYTITLTVTDDDGGSTVITADVIVNNVAPTIVLVITPPGDEGSSLTFEVEATDPGTDDLTFSWEFEYGPTIENKYYNNGVSPEPVYDPNTNEIKSPGGTFPFSSSDMVAYIYGDNYVYTLIISVTDDDGGTTTYTTTIDIDNLAPSFTEIIIPLNVDEGSQATYSATASDQGSDDLTFTWEFELGSTITTTYYNDGSSPDPEPSPWGTFPFSATDTVDYAYGDNGVYTVTFTVSDDDGGITTYTTDVIIDNVAPAIDSVAAPGGDEGSVKTYSSTVTDSGSDDLTFTWEWGDGTIDTMTIYYNDDTGPDPSPSPWGTFPYTVTDIVHHTYGDNGIYTVTLTVEDDDGGIATHTTDVTINNVAPAIDSVIAPGGDEGVELTYSSTATDQGSDDLTFTWDWGDGTSDTVTIYYNDGTGPDPSPSPWGTYPFTVIDTSQHTYGDNGVYTITLTVEDDDGDLCTYTRDVTIDNVAPAIDSATASGGDEGAKISYSSIATDQGSDDLTFIWDWGDGTSDTVTVYYNDGTGPDPYPSPWGTYPFTAPDTVSHSYGDNGVYTIILTVEDDDSGSTIYTKEITIENVVPTMDSVTAPGGDEGSILTYISTATDPGSDDLTFTWDWGDGTSDTVTVHYNDGVGPDPYPSPWGIYPFSVTDTVSHAYGDNGIYTITLTVEDDDGGVSIYITNVEIENVVPTITPFGPFSVEEGSLLDISAISTDPGSDDLTFTWQFELGPTITNVYYNDGLAPDPFPSPWGIFPFSITDTESHIYGDNGVFTLTLTVEDDDNGVSSYATNITVDNVAPTIVNLEAYMYVNFTLRVAGEKYHSVGMHLIEEGEKVTSAFVTRIPGNPDEQAGMIAGAKIDVTKGYTILVDYLPNDPRVNGNVWGANPVWIIMTFEDGSETRLHHTFNVRKSYWNDDHWNHIDPWEVELNSLLVGHNITFEASAEDPGSDDLIFAWEWGDGTTNTEMTCYNDGSSPDPYPSPWGIYPFTATDVQKHIFSFTGNYIVTLTAKDDDGGITTMSLDIAL